MGKLSKQEALYFGPQSIGSPSGAHCGECYKFVGKAGESGSCIEVEGSIAGPRGVCGLYIFGQPRVADPGFRLRKVSKSEASYAEVGPTNCSQCKYMKFPQQVSSICAKVEGVIHGRGCCNQFERREGT